MNYRYIVTYPKKRDIFDFKVKIIDKVPFETRAQQQDAYKKVREFLLASDGSLYCKVTKQA